MPTYQNSIIGFKESVAIRAAAYLFLVFTSIAPLTTSHGSHDVIVHIRHLSGILMLLAIFLFSSKGIAWKNTLPPLALFLTMIAWATLQANVNDVAPSLYGDFGLDIVIITLGIIVFSAHKSNPLPNGLAGFYAIYFIIALFVTVATDGLRLDFPPQFNYQHISEQLDAHVDYGHGLSNFFGIAALAGGQLASTAKSRGARGLSYILIIVAIFLSLLGGARGDSIIALFLTIALLVTHHGIRIIAFPCVITIAFFLAVDQEFLDNFTIVLRILELREGNMGMRDTLLLDTLELLEREPICMIAGCGIGFFQYFHKYDFSLYPHNFIAESAIIFGIPLTIIFFGLALQGFLHYVRRISLKAFGPWLITFHFLVSLKSGSFFGSWTLLAFCVVLASSTVHLGCRAQGRMSSTETRA